MEPRASSQKDVNAIRDLQKTLEQDVVQHIESYATSECRKLCNTLQQRLPIEMRELIYEFLLLEQSSYDIKEYQMLEGGIVYGLASPENPVRKRAYWTSKSHIIDHRYVGPVTKIEVAECWYRYCTFHVHASGDSHEWDLHEFSDKDPLDPWKFGLAAIERMRHVKVHWSTSQNIGTMGPSLKHLVHKLETLFILPTAANITIRLWLGHSHLQHRDSVGRLTLRIATLLPLFRRLIEAGYKLAIEMHDWSPVAILSSDLTVDNLSKKLAPIFTIYGE